MPSTAIRDIEYDDDRRQLWVTFVSGKVYAYDGVSADVHEAFRSASSKGTFFNRFIRDRYRHREVIEAHCAHALRHAGPALP